MSNKIYTDAELREINKKHDQKIGNSVIISNKVYSGNIEGRKTLGKSWSKRFQGPPYSTIKDKL